MRARRDLFESAFAFGSPRFNLAHGGQADFVEGLWASGEFFSGLGVPAILGRTLGHADDRRGGGPDGPVTVISYDYWRRRFGGAADVIGRSITIERVPFTVVGVTPPGFFGPDVGRRFDVAIPIGTEPLVRGREKLLDRRSFWWLSIMVRLKDGESRASAQRALRGVQSQIAAATLPEHAGARSTQVSGRALHARPGRRGRVLSQIPISAAGDHTDGGGGPRASDRVREHCQPPPRARHRPTP